MRSYGKTDKGIKRARNEDTIFYSDQSIGNLPNLYIIADGMGGHNAGAFASEYSVKGFVDFVKKATWDNPVKIIEDGICSVNQMVHEKSSEEEYYKMGTTFVVSTIIQKKLYIGNIGDSRLYIIRNKEIQKITKDHSLVEEMVHTGHLTEDEANSHPKKNIITRAIGAEKTIIVDIYEVELESDDLILMCSDGLTNMLSHKEISNILEDGSFLEDKVKQLISRANELGGNDNISVIIIKTDIDER
ncbi:Stp1/IreP family PP2C-type Ser/Thr phosphatase [Natranaerovirga pectinivora]|nr:Stp1/IreP family PP2C-type Ser/Thr phosphatase [Natranaerovirga pectinivora]